MSFENYGLSPELMSGLADTNMTEPTPLQQQVIPAALDGKHLLVKNETDEDGAFLIPALHTLTKNGEVDGTRILILTPSIERAKKIDETVWAMGYHAQISPADLSMKGDKQVQEEAVTNGAPVIVANPGRLIDILEKTKQAFTDLATIIIDEAHGMDNFNLVSRVKSILKYVDGDPQVLIFSASMNRSTLELADYALKNPEIIGFEEEERTPFFNKKEKNEGKTPEHKLAEASVEVVLNTDKKSVNEQTEIPEDKRAQAQADAVPEPESQEEKRDGHSKPDAKDETVASAIEELDHDPEEKLKEASVKVVLKKDQPEEKEESSPDDTPSVPKHLEQGYIHVPPRMKISTLMAHLESEPVEKIVIFAASKRTTDRLFRIILKKKWGVVSVHEGIDEDTYNERFGKFTSGEMKILLVGGMSARDIEIDKVQQVINYDVPSDVDEYRYRAELVGKGDAARMVSLVSKMDKEDIDKIVEEVGYAPEEIKLPEEVQEKKKRKSGRNIKKKNGGNSHRDKKTGRNGHNPVRRKGNDRKKDKKQKPGKKYELPRPSYEGLSGGRDGGTEKRGGVFGWVKKLFD